MEINWSLVIGAWGAVLSTSLAIPKLYEFWTNRFQIDITHVYRSDPGMGNEIHIRNLSGKPILLEYLDIYYKKGHWPNETKSYLWSPEDSLLNIKIEPSGGDFLTFSQADHYSCGSDKKVYVRLYFVGKKPIVKKLCG